MLTGPLVRVKFHRNRVIAHYVDPALPRNIELAQELLQLFDSSVGQTREEIEQLIKDAWGDEPGNFLLRGLVKIMDDNAEFAGVDDPPPAQVREALFRRAAALRREGGFDRDALIDDV